MTESQNSVGVDRRSVIKAAAWSAPVIAMAVATPLASASVNNSNLQWTGSQTGLLALNLLSNGNTLTAAVAITVPTNFTLFNGAGAINETANVTITVGRPGGLNLPIGRARGFGVYSLGGVNVASQNAVDYDRFLGSQVGFPITTFTGSYNFTAESNGTVAVPVVFGLSGSNSGITVSALASFPVTLRVEFSGGKVYTDTTTISIPVGAGVL